MIWKVLAIFEAILLVLGFTAIYLKVVMPGTVGELISTLVCIAMLIAYIGGGTGWLIIVALILARKEERERHG